MRKRAIREMARVVKPGGLVVLTDSAQVGDREAYDKTLGNFSDFNEPYYVNYINTPLGPLFQVGGHVRGRCGGGVPSAHASSVGGPGAGSWQPVVLMAASSSAVRMRLLIGFAVFDCLSLLALPHAGGGSRVRHEGEVAAQSWLPLHQRSCAAAAVCAECALTSCCWLLPLQLVGSSTKTLSFRKPLPGEALDAAGEAAAAVVAAAAETVQEAKEEP